MQLNENKIYLLFYTNEKLYSSAGKELCIALDVALGSSGCEAVVEGFYSLVKAHTQSGGQLNEVLMERAVVDLILPNPISCPEIVGEMTKLYIEGDKERLKPHQSVKFFDPACRAEKKYITSKVHRKTKRRKGPIFIVFVIVLKFFITPTDIFHTFVMVNFYTYVLYGINVYTFISYILYLFIFFICSIKNKKRRKKRHIFYYIDTFVVLFLTKVFDF